MSKEYYIQNQDAIPDTINYPKNVLIDDVSYNCTKGVVNDAWFCFDFKDKSANLPSYERNWVIDTSNNGIDWTQIDEKNNISDLKEKNRSQMYNIESKSFLRYCRFMHTSEYWKVSGYAFLRIGYIEL